MRPERPDSHFDVLRFFFCLLPALAAAGLIVFGAPGWQLWLGTACVALALVLPWTATTAKNCWHRLVRRVRREQKLTEHQPLPVVDAPIDGQPTPALQRVAEQVAQRRIGIPIVQRRQAHGYNGPLNARAFARLKIATDEPNESPEP